MFTTRILKQHIFGIGGTLILIGFTYVPSAINAPESLSMNVERWDWYNSMDILH
jgi:hypothetical protein